jgi:tetratricopeptide (TPR) repeat protein
VASRFPIDERRIYFAGFSGGARVAAMLAVSCQCTAGVLLNGAGFLSGTEPPRGSTFAVFSAVGDFDFNYAELIPLQDKLSQAGYPHWLRVFDGRHQWAPPEVMQEALAWFAVQAQKSHIAPRVGAFLNAQFAKEVARADSLEQAGDLFNAWRQNVQVAATFDGLEDVAAVRAKVDSLEKEKSVREGAKRERGEFDEQGRLTSAISDGLYSPMESSTTISEHTRTLVDQVRQLRSCTETEKRPERLRIYRRAVAAVFIDSLESGSHFLEMKDYPSAICSFRCATEAVPEFEGAWRNLAVAYSLADRKKETLATLRRARDVGKDPAAFTDWALKEPALDRWRSVPEFLALLNLH